jgi:hypothetical protein
MAFNKEDKVSYVELAPSLQELIDSKGTNEAISALAAQIQDLLNKLNNLGTDLTDLKNIVISTLNGIRITISITPPESPENNKELWVDLSTGLTKTYNNGWVSGNAVYK